MIEVEVVGGVRADLLRWVSKRSLAPSGDAAVGFKKESGTFRSSKKKKATLGVAFLICVGLSRIIFARLRAFLGTSSRVLLGCRVELLRNG